MRRILSAKVQDYKRGISEFARKAIRPRNLPKIRESSQARKDSIEAVRDMTKLLRAGLIEESLFLQRTFLPQIIDFGRLALRRKGATSILQRMTLNERAVERHVQRIAEILAASEVVGKLRTRRQAEREGLEKGTVVSTFAETFPSNVPPDEIVEWLQGLEAVPKSQWAAHVTKYRRFAFTVAATENANTLAVVRDMLARAVAEDWSEARFVEEARTVIPTIRSRLVWNNNVGFAMRRGRLKEMLDPAVARVIPFLIFDALQDRVVRPNHSKMDNGIAPATWKGWGRLGPPLGHNCRCQLTGLTASAAQAMMTRGNGFDLTKFVPKGAGPDKGFLKVAF